MLLNQIANLYNCICTIVFPPLDHVDPHELCFINIKLPCFQESTINLLYKFLVVVYTISGKNQIAPINLQPQTINMQRDLGSFELAYE
jgi:hypothetical protein